VDVAQPDLSSLVDLMRVVPIDDDRFRSTPRPSDGWWLYGGQVAAQALVAAGQTVDADRLPHSLHGYFLRGGDTARPTQFRVIRDRDGRSFSARRVEASQEGALIFTMSASFHRRDEGIDRQVEPVPAAGDPDALEPLVLPRLVSMECRRPEQPYPEGLLPTRYWARCTADLSGGPLLNAAVLTYLSDMSNGLMGLYEGPWPASRSLDHALWFHRPIRLDDWVLVDLVPHTAAYGRGWYTGTVHTRDGVLGASLTQESLFGRSHG